MKSKLLGLPMAAAFFSIVSLVQVCQACFSRTVVFSAGGDVVREPPEHRHGSAVHAMLAALGVAGRSFVRLAVTNHRPD